MIVMKSFSENILNSFFRKRKVKIGLNSSFSSEFQFKFRFVSCWLDSCVTQTFCETHANVTVANERIIINKCKYKAFKCIQMLLS